MQGVIREFLRYHGYEVGRWLQAVPESSWERGEGPQDFGVRVRIHPEVLMGEGDGVVPGQEAVARAEEALAWVLRGGPFGPPRPADGSIPTGNPESRPRSSQGSDSQLLSSSPGRDRPPGH